jgi:hypothetical protein
MERDRREAVSVSPDPFLLAAAAVMLAGVPAEGVLLRLLRPRHGLPWAVLLGWSAVWAGAWWLWWGRGAWTATLEEDTVSLAGGRIAYRDLVALARPGPTFLPPCFLLPPSPPAWLVYRAPGPGPGVPYRPAMAAMDPSTEGALEGLRRGGAALRALPLSLFVAHDRVFREELRRRAPQVLLPPEWVLAPAPAPLPRPEPLPPGQVPVVILALAGPFVLVGLALALATLLRR